MTTPGGIQLLFVKAYRKNVHNFVFGFPHAMSTFLSNSGQQQQKNNKYEKNIEWGCFSCSWHTPNSKFGFQFDFTIRHISLLSFSSALVGNTALVKAIWESVFAGKLKVGELIEADVHLDRRKFFFFFLTMAFFLFTSEQL